VGYPGAHTVAWSHAGRTGENVVGPIYSSDHMPFETHSWVTIGAFEGEGNANYHNTSDDVGTIDLDYFAAVTQMTLQLNLVTAAEASSRVDLYT
jgi:hypothetical protein